MAATAAMDVLDAVRLLSDPSKLRDDVMRACHGLWTEKRFHVTNDSDSFRQKIEASTCAQLVALAAALIQTHAKTRNVTRVASGNNLDCTFSIEQEGSKLKYKLELYYILEQDSVPSAATSTHDDMPALVSADTDSDLEARIARCEQDLHAKIRASIGAHPVAMAAYNSMGAHQRLTLHLDGCLESPDWHNEIASRIASSIRLYNPRLYGIQVVAGTMGCLICHAPQRGAFLPRAARCHACNQSPTPNMYTIFIKYG
jgi:hypothetical protein